MTSNTDIVSFNDKIQGATNLVHYIDAYTDCATNYGDNVIPLDASLCYTKASGVLYDSCNNTVDETKNYYTTISGDIVGADGSLTYGDLKSKLITNISGYSDINDYTADVNDLKKLVNDSYDPSFNYIINQHENNKKKQNELDFKMRELYEEEKSDTKILYDNSVFLTMTYTVLATSLLYYLFVKL